MELAASRGGERYSTFEDTSTSVIVRKSDDDRPAKPQSRVLAAWRALPPERWRPSYYFATIHGAQWLHLYLWCAKDLAWMQDWYYPGLVLGFGAVVWSLFLLVRSAVYKNWIQVVHYVGQLLWLFANAWWMYGELHDYQYPNDPEIYDRFRESGSHMMASALCFMVLFYLLRAVRLLNFLTPSTDAAAVFDTGEYLPHLWLRRLFPTWRSYENVHIVLWLGMCVLRGRRGGAAAAASAAASAAAFVAVAAVGLLLLACCGGFVGNRDGRLRGAGKDAGWIHNLKWLWWPFAIPTILVSLDFALTTSFHARGTIDHAHYVMQFFWVSANLVWAGGELYLKDDKYDLPQNLLPSHNVAIVTARWWGSWCAMLAFIVGICLHVVWVPATYLGKIKDEHGAHHHRPREEEEPTQPLISSQPSAKVVALPSDEERRSPTPEGRAEQARGSTSPHSPPQPSPTSPSPLLKHSPAETS
jgi:hypothetical protein